MKSMSHRGLLFTIFVIVFLDLLGLTLIIPVLAPLFLDPVNGILPHAHEGTRTFLLGLLLAAYPLAQFFAAPFLGALSDKYGRKPILLIPLVGTFIGYIIFGYGIITASLSLLFISRLLDGFGGGNLSVALSAVADISTEKTKARHFGLVGAAYGLGFILGPFIGGRLADSSIVSWFNYATPFWFAAGLALFNIILMLFLFPETNHKRIHTKASFFAGIRNIRRAFELKNLRVMFLVVFMLMFGFTFFTQFFQVFLFEKFKYTQTTIGEIFAYVGVWIALTQVVLMRPLSKRYSPQTILSFSIFILAIFFALLVIPHRAFWLYIILPFIAIMSGLIIPSYSAIVSNLGAKDSQGEVLGINQSVQSLAQAIPPVLAGIIVSVHPSAPTLVAAFMTLLAGIIFVGFFNPRNKQNFHEI